MVSCALTRSEPRTELLIQVKALPLSWAGCLFHLRDCSVSNPGISEKQSTKCNIIQSQQWKQSINATPDG